MNAIGLYKVGNMCYQHKIPIIPKLTKSLIYAIFHCVVPYQCTIGKGTRFAYGGIGVVLHSRCQIGDNCIIGTQVTIGGNKSRGGGPHVGNRCYIATGAKVLGNITIGDEVFIGANSVVTSDVPRKSLISGIPAKIIKDNINICEYSSHM